MTYYPELNLTNKNHLAKKIAGTVEKKTRTVGQMKLYIEECEKNFEKLWMDNPKMTDVVVGKFFRNCKRTVLGTLLNHIDKLILAPYDEMLPCHIHGGIKGVFVSKNGKIVRRSSESAALSLVNGRNSWLVKMDLKRFYEQITKRDIVFLLHEKCGCSLEISDFIADLATVKKGAKNAPRSQEKVLARGFATSTRLAVWTKINFFLELRQQIRKICKNSPHKIVIYIDDIGVCVRTDDMGLVLQIAKQIKKTATRHNLEINDDKTEITPPEERKELLGCLIGNNGIIVDSKSQQKEAVMKKRFHAAKKEGVTKKLKKRWRAHTFRRVRIENLS